MAASMTSEPEYIQLTSWEDFISWLEKEGYKAIPIDNWNPPPKRKKKGPPQEEGLF